MLVAILGAGAGGAAAAAELTQAGHDVVLWNRSPGTLAPFQQQGGVGYEGVLGGGLATLRRITADLGEVVNAVDAAVVMLPTFAHGPLARDLARAGWPADKPILLNPGHTGGALEFAAAFGEVRPDLPPIAEFSTLTYVARKYAPGTVTVSGRARQVRAAALPGGGPALDMAQALFASADPVADVLAVGFANVNSVLHPPGAILSAAWVEARSGDFNFYVEGMTPGVVRVMRLLDDERRRVAARFGHDLPNLIEEMRRIGTVEADVTDTEDYAAAISSGTANRKIRAPDTLQHRYYREDFGHGLLPFLEFAAIAEVEVPVARALFDLAGAAVGVDYRKDGRTAARMGIAGLGRNELVQRVRGT
jgi:opine dehydrogenase